MTASNNLLEALLQEHCWVLLGRSLLAFSALLSALERVPLPPSFWNWEVTRLTRNSNLLCNMVCSRETRCSDPRDRIYALCSISTDGHTFPVDYSDDVCQTYVRFAAKYASNKWLSSLLVCATVFRNTPEVRRTLPSWTPDWRGGWSPSQASFFSLVRWRVRDYSRNYLSFFSGPINPVVQLGEKPENATLTLDCWTSPGCEHDDDDRSCLYCSLSRNTDSYEKAEEEAEMRRLGRIRVDGLRYSSNSWARRPQSPDLYCLLGDCDDIFALRRAHTSSRKSSDSNVESYELMSSFELSKLTRSVLTLSTTEIRVQLSFSDDREVRAWHFTKEIEPMHMTKRKICIV